MTEKITLFMVRGTGARTLQSMIGSTLGNFDQMVGEGLNPAVWDLVDVAYPGDQLSLEAFLSMGNTAAVGVDVLTGLINALPAGRKFAMVGMSQGAIVISRVYDQIVSGSLSSRNADFVAGITFGNPRRKAGHSIPNGDSPGGTDSRGVLADDLMTSVDSRWWDFVNTGDMAADIRFNTEAGKSSERIFQLMWGNYWGEGSFLDYVLDSISAGFFQGVSASSQEIEGIARAMSGFGGLFMGSLDLMFFSDPAADPHLTYHLPYTNLPGNTKSAVELAVDRLNAVAATVLVSSGVSAALSAVREVDRVTSATRSRTKSLRQAKPLIRIWMNNPEQAAAAGAVYVGRIDMDDTIKGSFPFKNNAPTQGTLELRDDHYMSMFFKKLPNDSSLRKNLIITVDFYGGTKRWSGLMDKWEVKTRDGVKYLEVTFQDDLTHLQYLLCPPNPALAIPIFQFPRIFSLAGPAKWAVAMTIFLNLLRTQANFYTLPDDPFDFESWDDLWDWSDWQCHVKAPRFIDDTSLWTFIASRMNPVDSIIAETLDDAQLTITYRRIITDDGEICSPNQFVPNVKNCALVFEVVNNSQEWVDPPVTGFPGVDTVLSTFLNGTVGGGLVRTGITYGSGFVEDVFSLFSEDQTLAPDEYFQNGFMGTIAKQPWVVLRDNEWTAIESSSLAWGPSKNVSVVVGGDNPAADAIAKLTIETIGNLLGALIMFSSLGTIIADVVMPFLAGCIAAWLYWKNNGRAQELGWIHYLEAFQQGGEANSWSLSAVSALRGGFLASKSETHHVMALHDSWMIPGIHADIGHRVGSTIQSKGLEDIIWVNQIEEMVAQWENTMGSQQPYSWMIKCGRNERMLSLGERLARISKKVAESANNIGLSLIQA